MATELMVVATDRYAPAEAGFSSICSLRAICGDLQTLARVAGGPDVSLVAREAKRAPCIGLKP
jgi:hypothetical protein